MEPPARAELSKATIILAAEMWPIENGCIPQDVGSQLHVYWKDRGGGMLRDWLSDNECQPYRETEVK